MRPILESLLERNKGKKYWESYFREKQNKTKPPKPINQTKTQTKNLQKIYIKIDNL